MGYMQFKDPTLEQMFGMFKWARNNTIQIFESAEANDILSYTPKISSDSPHTFQPLIFQFQCIITTTDAFYRKLSRNAHQEFGVLYRDGQVLLKKQITVTEIKKILEAQLQDLETLYQPFSSEDTGKNLETILSLPNHEYLHQGQMIVNFRETGVELPKSFVKAWAL